MGFYAVISNSNGNARVIVITCHSPALLISSAGASIANLKQETNSLNSLCNSGSRQSETVLCVCARVCLLCGFECPQTTLESLKSFKFERWTREENATWRKTEGLLSFRFLFIATIFLAVVWPNNAVIWCGAVLNYSLCFEACLCESVCVCDSQSPGNTEELERHQTSCWQTILSICSCNPSMEMRCIHFIQRDKASFFKCSFWAITLITDSTELPDKYRCEEPYSFCSLSQTITHYQFKKTKQINKFLESI